MHYVQVSENRYFMPTNASSECTTSVHSDKIDNTQIDILCPLMQVQNVQQVLMHSDQILDNTQISCHFLK